MTDTVGFSVGAVARRLGVAPSTLRTWNRRYGIGARELSPGRHRRYTAEDIVRLEHMQKLILRGAAPADAARAAMAAPVTLVPAQAGGRRAPGRTGLMRTARGLGWPGSRAGAPPRPRCLRERTAATGRTSSGPVIAGPVIAGPVIAGAAQATAEQATARRARAGPPTAPRPHLPMTGSRPPGQGRVMAPAASAWHCPVRRQPPAAWPALCWPWTRNGSARPS